MQQVIEKLAASDNTVAGDYMKDGLLVCGKCHTPKQTRLEKPSASGKLQVRVLPITCKCVRDEEQQEQARNRKQQFDAHMNELAAKYGVSDGTYREATFALDDKRDAKLSSVCHRYVEKWDDMRENNMGILFYGAVGTGKTFYASAIANALLDKCVSATVTNFPRLLNILQGERERQAYIDHLQAYKLLVIDDLGVERDSAYAAEQIFGVIDARSRSKLPLIVTTNLSLEEMEKPPTMQFTRIYDRVLEMCPIRLRMTGESRRTGNAETRRKIAKEILMG